MSLKLVQKTKKDCPGQQEGGRRRRQKMRIVLLTAIVFAIVVDHEHDLPFEDVAVADQAARYARDILSCLHLL